MLQIPTDNKLGPLSGLLLIAVAAIVFGAMGQNELLTVVAVATLLSGVWLLWRPGEAPILLLVFFMWWLQARVNMLYANLQGSSGEDTASSGDVESAILLSLFGVMALACGLRLGAGKANRSMGETILRESKIRSPRDWFFLYGFAWVGAFFTQFLATFI